MNLMTPGSVLWLLRHEMRITWRTWWDATRTRGWGRIAFYGLTAFWLLLFGFWIATVLDNFPPVANVLTLSIVSLVFVGIGTLMLSQALVLITDALYQRGDMDLLLASPLPPWRILIVRMAAIALNVATFYLMLAVAIFVCLPFFGAWGWMAFAPSLFALALFATSLGIVVSRALFRVLGPRTTRTVAQILAALTGAAFFLVYQFNAFAAMERNEDPQARAAQFDAMIAGLESRWSPSSPLFIPARAALGEPAALLLWIGATLLLYAAAVWWFARSFVSDSAAVAAASGAAKPKRAYASRAFRGGRFASLVRKEWRLLRRDPLVLSQVLLPLLYFAPVVFLMWRNLSEGDLTRTALSTTAGAIVFISSLLSAGLVWLAVSAEDAPDLIAAAPVPDAHVERAKAVAATAPVFAVLTIPAIAALFVSPIAALWFVLGAGAAIVSTALIGIWHKAPAQRKDFRRRARTSLAANFGQFFVTLAWAAATGLAVWSGWGAILALIPTLIALGLLLALHESHVKDPAAAAEARAVARAEKAAKARAAS